MDLPRHAQVVPALVAATIRSPLSCGAVAVHPAELLRWERPADLSDSVRQELRQTIVRRMQARAHGLWSHPTGVRLVHGWQAHLAARDRRRVEVLLLTDARPLECWTLREVKDALGATLGHTLALLARLEALYWVPPPASPHSPPEIQEQAQPVSMSPELQRRANEALALPWLGKVTRHDLRFGQFAPEGEEPVADWIASHLQAEAVPASFPAWLDRLLQADQLTAADEARELALEAARKCALRSGGDEPVQRRVSMLMRRYLSRTGAGRKLSEVGAEFGVTKQRVLQVCEPLEAVFRHAEMVTPVLDRVLEAAARMSPASTEEIDEQLRSFMGEDAGIASLLGWAAVLGREAPAVQHERVRTRVRGQVVDVTLVQAADALPWVAALIRHVSRDSSMFGCTNLVRVAGRLALQEGVAPGQAAIEAALEGAAGFRWLDRQAGWFTLGDSSGCSAASRVRKVMAVAHEAVGTDEITGALASDDMWMYRESTSLGLATPPVHVLRELFLGWPWLKVVQRGRFAAGPGFDPTGVLSDIEQVIVQVITAHDGVACRFEFREVVVGQLELTDAPLSAALGSSPIVERIEQGIYRLRGRRFGDLALEAARHRLRERTALQRATPADAGLKEFLVGVTESSLRREKYHVPPRLCAELGGRRHHTVAADGRSLGEARVSRSGELAGLNRLFPHARPGDHYRIEVLPDCLCVRLCAATAQ